MQNTRYYYLKKILGLLFMFLLFGCKEKNQNHNLGKGYKLYTDEGGYTVCICDTSNTLKIDAYILECKFDNNFIIAMQSPRDSLPPMKIIIYTDDDRKEIIHNNKVFKQYWVINKKEKEIFSYDSLTRNGKYSNIYGPYSKLEYLKQRKILKVPDNLKLSD